MTRYRGFLLNFRHFFALKADHGNGSQQSVAADGFAASTAEEVVSPDGFFHPEFAHQVFGER
jgi:hypothetical protein